MPETAKQQRKIEAELAKGLKQRSPKVVAKLYQRYALLVYSLIARIVKNSVAAEDLTQETFLRVWNRGRSYDAPGSALKPWILTVARNRAVDYIRSAENAAISGSPKLGWMEHPQQFRDFTEATLSEERAASVQSAFARLTASQKSTLELAYYEGLSISEIATRLDEPQGIIRTWLESSIRVLRGAIDPLRAMTTKTTGSIRTADIMAALAIEPKTECDPFEQSFELYSLGLLSGDEKAAIHDHLQQGCDHCQQYMTDALALKALMMENAPAMVPPQRLEERVLAAVGIHRQVWAVFATVAAAGFLVAALWFSMGQESARSEADQLRARLAQKSGAPAMPETDSLTAQERAILGSPATGVTPFQGLRLEGNLYRNTKLGLLLLGKGFSPRDDGRVFQLEIDSVDADAPLTFPLKPDSEGRVRWSTPPDFPQTVDLDLLLSVTIEAADATAPEEVPAETVLAIPLAAPAAAPPLP